MEDVTSTMGALSEVLRWFAKMTDHDCGIMAGQLREIENGRARAEWDNSAPLGFLGSLADLMQTAALVREHK